ncbi:Gfo/Idh/MocA family oxidoreductase [candidate division KSB1 bacterium]|nr:Gfo/Idh/MocA family oxidoreductase [candidate division KSB1 bacterium]
MIRFAVAGFGFIGKLHADIILKHPKAELAAVVDSNLSKIDAVTKGNIDTGDIQKLPAKVARYQSFEKMLQDTSIDCVSICVPTFMHKKMSVQALEAGKHVICEKPMALSLEDCDQMIETAERTNRHLFIGQCLRFWPEYIALKQKVQKTGLPKSIIFRRVSPPPSWADADNWFFDPLRSGGCLFDLHVHDVDMINFLFGEPVAVFSTGNSGSSGINISVITQYIFSQNMACLAEASWQYPDFKMAYSAVFETGLLEYDCTQNPSIYFKATGESKAEVISIADGDGYIKEYDYFIDCLEKNKAPEIITAQSARQSIKITLMEQQSLHSGRVVQFR